MYLNLQIGKFNIVVGKPTTRPAKKPMVMQVSHPVMDGRIVDQEFIIDDESKLRYQN